MGRPIRLVLAAGLALGGGAAVSAPAQAAACSTTSGVTVVVTFPGGSTVTRCAPGDPASGLAALGAAGFSTTQVQRFPGAVCRIDGQPASDACVTMPPTTAYWSYWHASRGGSWSYSSVGAGAHDPAPGSVEGWSFGSGGPPAVSPPPPVAGPKPTPRPSTTSPTPRASTTSPTPRPSTTSPRPRPSSTTSASRPTTPGATARSGDGSVVVVSKGGTTTTLPVLPGSRSATTSTAGLPAAGTSTAPTDLPTSTADAVQATGPRTAAPTSTPWSLVAGVLAIAALGLTAFAARRRRATH